MEFILDSFPITEDAGFYSNVFRGFVKEEIELFVSTALVANIVDNSGLLQIVLSSELVFIDGAEIVVKGANYDFTIGTITGLDPFQVFTDIPFVADAGDVHIYVQTFEAVENPNLRMSYRFAEFTTQDDQDAANLFGNDFTYYPDRLGKLRIDISLISSLMKPNFDFTNEVNTDMSKVYQVQYRPVFDGSSEDWISAHDSGLTAFVPFISIHAGGRIAKVDNSNSKATPDFDLITRMWKGYKKILTAMVVDDNTTAPFSVVVLQYAANKITVVDADVLFNTTTNGLINVTIPNFGGSVRYIKFDIGDDNLIDSVNYMTVHDTLQNANEFYLTWASELGTIRNWLFTSKIDFTNKAKYDILQDSEFRQIPNKYDEKLLLQAKGLSEIEKNYVYDIYLSNKIILENDGEEFECIVSKPSFSFENRSNSYICTIEIMKSQRDLMNV